MRDGRAVDAVIRLALVEAAARAHGAGCTGSRVFPDTDEDQPVQGLA